MTHMTRRHMIAGAGVGLAGLAGMPGFATETENLISRLTGGAGLKQGLVTLDAPEIAENGNGVSIEVTAPGAKSVTVYADGNPAPNVATFNFGPLNPTQRAATRIRLARTQNVYAVAEMADGSWQLAQAEVKVTYGGCGG